MRETRYAPDHVWVRLQGSVATLGLTRFALNALGAITALRLPPPGLRMQAGEPCGEIESVKAASDIGAPFAGEVIRSNLAASTDPNLVNRDPEGEGWLCEVTPDSLGAFASLMDAAAYDAFIQAL